jgi:carboxylesterase type B
LRQTLQQTAQTYDLHSMVDAEPAIRQFLKLEFEPKVKNTILKTFPQTINQTLKNLLVPMAEQQADDILQQYTQARAYLEQSLQQEAEEKLEKNRISLKKVEEKIANYNSAVSQINNCLLAMHLNFALPVINNKNVQIPVTDVEFLQDNTTSNENWKSQDLTDSITSTW